ncbi:YihY/virulence factor BrkB family protein [Streptomyces sp. NBC_00513]|uniref:YhjD/YihY/BrkB family envelope integrity protein n=1 Tax=unclassified Streptomyces TaxID=2593676 RepID=UPI00224D9BD6|nr:YhjD/YihY/BrkB family envelope integrity protein [Streptomyces sp. NBC_00424]MCX5071624.1 YihY/virulence factor BrkB family protein [Streptomyces sp. NBC_00424]WUD44984.1 YihY/virulence factor BrkB family protein [Streptomyces sp. NBC_00513]
MSWKERLRDRRARTEERFPVVTELTGRLLSTNLLDGATRLASQAFLASVPLLFAVAAFAPQSVRDQLRESLRTVFGLTGQADAQLQQVLGSSTGKSLRETTGTIGLLMALISATSFSRAMARVCERAWRLPKSRTRIAVWRWFAWLLALLLVVFMEGPIREGFGAGLWVGIPLSFLLGVGVWLWTQHLFLAGRIGWMALLPGAVLSSVATTVLSLSAALYMPTALNRALHEYGSLGLVLTLLSWLIAICATVTFAVTIGAVLAQEPPLNRFLTTDRSTP